MLLVSRISVALPCSIRYPDRMEALETRLRVRYAETDQMGVVYYANYFIWMEVGRVEFCRTSGIRYRDIEAGGYLLVVAEANCRYITPARYDDEIVISTTLADASPRMLALRLRHRSIPRRGANSPRVTPSTSGAAPTFVRRSCRKNIGWHSASDDP